jgi:cytochrome b561
MLGNTQARWGSIAKGLHWLIALLIFAAFPLGWIAVAWALSPAKLNLFTWHKSVGMLILLLVVARIVWRLCNPVPRPPSGMPRWQRAAASADHFLQYALTLAVPASGWLIDSAANIPFRVFWLFPLPHLTAPSPGLEQYAKSAHLGLSIALAILIVIHTGAALWHHFVDRDNVLLGMLPSRGAR